MPNKPLHLCYKPNCSNLTRERYCETHKQEINKYNKERTDKDYVRFYYSKEWQQLRMLVLKRDGYLCVSCRSKGIVKLAEMVHHKIPIKIDYNKRLDLDNLESLCEACHNKIDHNPHPFKSGDV